MAPIRFGTIQGLVWVSCVLFQMTVLVQGQSNSTLDGTAFNATIDRLERTRRFDVYPWNRPFFTFPLPINGTTKADAIVTLSPSPQADVDIFCSPSTTGAVASLRSDPRTAVWRSNHTHGDAFVFISQHHPRYADGLVPTEDGDVVLVFCVIRNNEAYFVSVSVDVEYDYDTREMRQEDEEAMESIFTKCCQSEDSCKAWKEHRANNGSVQSDLCHFHMNFCKSDGHLYRLSLENLNMQCEFPYEEITQFKQLKKLLLKGNKFTGTVGKVLTELSNLPELEDIDISDSQLTGSLVGNSAVERSAICRLARNDLVYLKLERNNITGELPACLLYTRSRIKDINLDFNKITGTLPRVSGFSRKLEVLHLAGNQLTGEIPASYAEGDSLETLDLSNNQITGKVPGEFGSSTSLRYLILSSNKLSGPFPERLTETSILEYLSLSNNSLTGELPDSIGMMDLLVLDLGSNSFTGSLPSSLSNVTYLRVLELNNNSLTGSIENALPLSMTQLDLSDNQFTGAIPASITTSGFSTIHSRIQLSNNNFSSFDDIWYGYRTPFLQIGEFLAANNSIKGTFPSALADAPVLRALDLSNNELSGRLPSDSGDLWSLLILNLSSNAFIGHIPKSWGRTRLFYEGEATTVDLSFNQLSGPIPGFLYEIPKNGEVNKTIDLEGNIFDVECPLPESLSFINGLICNPDYSAVAQSTEASLTAIEGDLPESILDIPAESSIAAPEASETTSTSNESMSTARNISITSANTTTVADGRGTTESPTVSTLNEQTTEAVETQSLEGGSDKSNSNALWIPVVVVGGFALLLALLLVIRRVSNSKKAARAAAGGAAGGGMKPVPLISLSTLESSKALPPQREPSKEDGVHMLVGVQSSAEI